MRVASALVLAGAAAIGLGVGLWPMLSPAAPIAAVETGETIEGCRVTDGDTIRCGEERVRLLGIDAPELAGHCRRGRRCAPGDPVASREALRGDLVGTVRIVRVGEDRYGRTLGMVSTDVGDLSCRQLARGAAVYRGNWDNGKRVAATCPDAAGSVF